MILVFGKTGQVATELQISGNVLALDRNFDDISNPSSCYNAIKIHAPEAVINAAAYTSVIMQKLKKVWQPLLMLIPQSDGASV